MHALLVALGGQLHEELPPARTAQHGFSGQRLQGSLSQLFSELTDEGLESGDRFPHGGRRLRSQHVELGRRFDPNVITAAELDRLERPVATP